MKTLVLYSTIVGGFFAQTKEVQSAVTAAMAEVGNDVWKRGFSAAQPGGATAALNKSLKDSGASQIKVEGSLDFVGFVENRDAAGNSYPKLRIGLTNGDTQMLVSLELKGDVAQRLVPKLDNCMPGMHIKISAWPNVVARDGRDYINHAASIKDAEGNEIPVNAAFNAALKKETDAIAESLVKMGITDKKTINSAKVNKRIDGAKAFIEQISARFVTEVAND
jgi:hypothetical protein